MRRPADRIYYGRLWVLAANHLYENHTETPISDAVYEFGLSNLCDLMKEFPKEWEECPLHPEYFLDQELGWKSTSMGSPVCNLVQEEADRLLYICSLKE